MTKEGKSRYYFQYDDVPAAFRSGHRGAWQVFDRQLLNRQGGVEAIVVCIDRDVAKAITEALNFKDDWDDGLTVRDDTIIIEECTKAHPWSREFTPVRHRDSEEVSRVNGVVTMHCSNCGHMWKWRLKARKAKEPTP